MQPALRCFSYGVHIAIAFLVLLSTGCLSGYQLKMNNLYGASRFGEVVEIGESELSQGRTATTTDLFYLCSAYAQLKRYNKLFPCLDQLEARIKMGDTTTMGFDWSPLPNLLRGQAYLELGNSSRATEEAQKSYNIVLARDSQPYIKVWSLSVLALAYALNGDRANAIKYTALLEDVGTNYPYNILTKPKALGLARVYMRLGDYEKSLTMLQEGSSWLEALASSLLRYEELPRQFLIQKCLFELGRVNEAKKGYEDLLRDSSTKDNGEIYWLILFDLGRIAESERRPQEAIRYYQDAVVEIERQRSTINTETSRIGFVGDKQQVYHRLIATLFANGQAAQAYEYVERAKARALVDLLASKQDFAVSGQAPQQVTMLVKDLDQTEDEARTPAVFLGESGRRSGRGVQVKANLQTTAPELASLVMVTEVTSSAIQALLQPDETLVEYYYQGDDLYAFVVKRDRVQGIKLNGANLAREVEDFRKALEDPKSARVGELSRSLYGRLIQPVAAQVTTKRLLIVGHGVLHYLPFTALSNDTGYLVDQYSIRLLPSASVMQFLSGRRTQKAETMLAFGNPDMGDAHYDLKFAQDEVQAIAKDFPQAKVLVRQEATKSAFQTLGPQFSYLHFATHGKFDPDVPLKSGLLLAKDTRSDGFLGLGDLYSMRLNADLVTLSACETGLGKVQNGDDVVGLTRGFLYAGSNTIVASLWQVDDRATAELMVEFYQNLKKTDKREALRQAQLTIKQRYPHPFYWAAFQLTGMP